MHAFPEMRRALDGIQGIAVQRAYMRYRDTTHAERMRSDVLLLQDIRRCTTVGSTPHGWTHHENVVCTGRGQGCLTTIPTHGS
jgi:hypothetical protein